MFSKKWINDITICYICNEPFVDPKVLPCVHTFCLQCLESEMKCMKAGSSLNCPICRAEFELPSDKFSDLPGNFFIQKLLDINKIAREPGIHKCDGCCEENDTSRSATSYCVDCRQNLCDQCCQVHSRLRYNKTHKVVEISKKEADELLKVSPTFCETHKDELVVFVCFDCELTICKSCHLGQHKSHKCTNITKVSEELLQNLKEDVLKVAEHIKTCLHEEEKLQRKKSNFLQHKENQKLEVSKILKELHRLVDNYGKQLLTELQAIEEVKLEEYVTAYKKLQDRLVIMESFKRYSEEVMAKAAPADITRLAAMLKKRASELHTMRLDNDFFEFDIGISSSSLITLLKSKIENPVGDLAVWNNRRENDKAFLPGYCICPLPPANEKLVYEVKNIGQELYVLNKGAPSSSGDILIGTKILKLLLPQTYQVTTPSLRTNCNMSGYTACDAVVIHLKLWLRNSETGQTWHLEASDLSLVESDGVLETSATFELHSLLERQPSNIWHYFELKAPPKLGRGYVYGLNIKTPMTGTVSSLTVQGTSVDVLTEITRNYSCTSSTTLPLSIASKTASPLALDVYSTVLGVEEDRTNSTSKMIGGMILKLKMPDNFINRDGTSVARTNYTRSDCVLIFLQLNHNMSSDGDRPRDDHLELIISKLSLSDSDHSFVEKGNMKVPEIKLQDIADTDHDVTIKAPQKLKNNGFHGIDIKVKVGTTSKTVTVEASVTSINTTEGKYPEESNIKIPTMTRTTPLKFRRTITLPTTFDPSGMASCNYYQCIYIGDRQSSSVYRFEPTGKRTKWSVGDVPDGLSVTTSHSLVVTISKTSELKEFDTSGILLRLIHLGSLSKSPTFSVQMPENRFIVITRESACVYLATVQEASVAAGKVHKAEVKEMVHLGDSVTPTSVPQEKLDGSKAKDAEVEKEGRGKSCVQLNGPIQVAVDRFGFVFILTANDAKVHLLSPQLNYMSELIDLNKHGVEKPSRLHFDDMSGILYVASNTGPVTIMGFKVMEECIYPSLWKKE